MEKEEEKAVGKRRGVAMHLYDWCILFNSYRKWLCTWNIFYTETIHTRICICETSEPDMDACCSEFLMKDKLI